MFTYDGWLRSGDIGQVMFEGNRMKIIDRKKNLFKLSQGDYIAPEKLENLYRTSHVLINDVFVYGNSLKSSIISVVNIIQANLVSLCQEIGYQGDMDDLKDNRSIKGVILDLLHDKAKQQKLSNPEIPTKVHIETTPFTDLGLLTTTFKKRRRAFEVYYHEIIEKMYENMI